MPCACQHRSVGYVSVHVSSIALDAEHMLVWEEPFDLYNHIICIEHHIQSHDFHKILLLENWQGLLCILDMHNAKNLFNCHYVCMKSNTP
jgi:hypothetical protein